MKFEDKSFGKQLNQIANDVITAKNVKRIQNKKYIENVYLVAIKQIMIKAASDGKFTCCVNAKDCISEDYFNILKLDFRSSSKKELVKDVIELLSYECRDVRVNWIKGSGSNMNDQINFEWM